MKFVTWEIVSMRFITMTIHNIQRQMSTNILKLFLSMFTSTYQIPRYIEIGHCVTGMVQPPDSDVTGGVVGCAGRIRYTARRKEGRKSLPRVSMSRSFRM